MKKDIITLTGLTAEDGSIVTSGAHIALEIEIPISFDGYQARIKVFRNKQIFENGYQPVRILNMEDELRKETTEDILTSSIYDDVVTFINGQYENPVCEIVN